MRILMILTAQQDIQIPIRIAITPTHRAIEHRQQTCGYFCEDEIAVVPVEF